MKELNPGSLNGLLGWFWGKFVERMSGFSNSSAEVSTMDPKITSEKPWEGRFAGWDCRRVATHRKCTLVEKRVV